MTDLPSSWAVAPLGDLIAPNGIFTDGDWVESKDQDPNGDVRLIQLADIADSRFLDKSSRFLTRQKADELRCTFLMKGDLMVARMPDPLGRCCIFPLDGKERFVTVVDVCAIRVGSAEVDPRFLMRAINSPIVRAQVSALESGSTRKRISRKNLATVSIPVPPLNEQHRIAARIDALFDEIDRGVESLRDAKRTIDLYRQSLLKSAFEGRLTSQWRIENPDKLECPEELLARIREQREERYQAAIDDWRRALAKWRHGGNAGRGPKKPKQHVEVRAKHIPHEAKPTCVGTWASARLGDLNVLVSDGPFGSNLMTRDYTDTGVRVVRLENIGYGKFLEEKRSFISHEKFETIKKHSVVPGTIVVSSFVTEGIRCCIVPKSISIAVNKADCLAVTVLGERTRREFLAYFLQSRQAFGQLEGVVHGVGRPRINTAQLRELHVPVCDPAEQFEIVRILDARLRSAEALDTEIDTNIARAEALRQSILKKAFSGDLVPQDPNDEPAHALLARIRSSRQGDATAKPRRSSRRRARASTPP